MPEELAATARRHRQRHHDQPERRVYAEQILTAANDAFIAGWQQAMRVGVAVMTVLMIFVLFRGPKSFAPTERLNETDDQAQNPTTGSMPVQVEI